MNKWLEILLGLILLCAAICAWAINFWDMGTSALAFFKGGIVWFFILLGILFLIIGVSDLKD